MGRQHSSTKCKLNKKEEIRETTGSSTQIYSSVLVWGKCSKKNDMWLWHILIFKGKGR